MPRLSDVTRNVRSKAAGPFWVTLDIFFDGPESFAKYHDSNALGGDAIARIYGVNGPSVKHTAVEALSMIKISYPRPTPVGWIEERDLHSGQQFVRLLDVEID